MTNQSRMLRLVLAAGMAVSLGAAAFQSVLADRGCNPNSAAYSKTAPPGKATGVTKQDTKGNGGGIGNCNTPGSGGK